MPKDGYDLGILIRLRRRQTEFSLSEVSSELFCEVGRLKDHEVWSRLTTLVEEGLVKVRSTRYGNLYSITEWAGRPGIKCPKHTDRCSAIIWNCGCGDCPVPVTKYGMMCFSAIECSESGYEDHGFPAVCLNRNGTPPGVGNCFKRVEKTKEVEI